MTPIERSIGLITLVATMTMATSSAWAYPAFGEGVDGNCYECHSTIVNDRMELLDFTGVIDPIEMQGVPDQGPLKYYSAPAGGDANLVINAIDGTENYAFQIIGFDDPDVTQGGTLVYDDDPDWLLHRGPGFPTYFAAADGDYDGYDWGTSDPVTMTFNLHVDASTPPGYYLMRFALVGRDVLRDGWFDGELFYIEVTGGASGPTLSVDASCPGGGPIRIEWSGATGGAQIGLIYARNTGSFVIPNGNPCSGTPLGLGSNGIQLVYQGSAGNNGSRVLNANAGNAACGAYFQLLDVATCRTSNVVQAQ